MFDPIMMTEKEEKDAVTQRSEAEGFLAKQCAMSPLGHGSAPISCPTVDSKTARTRLKTKTKSLCKLQPKLI